MHQRLLQLITAAGFDNAKDRLRTGQIKLAGEKGPHGEFAGLSGASAGAQTLGDNQLNERRTRNRVQLDDILACEAVRSGPDIKIGGKACRRAG